MSFPTRRVFCAILLTCSVHAPLFAASSNKGNNDSRRNNIPNKVDRALAGALKGGAAKNKVIITTMPGERNAIRKALEQHGDTVKREHAALNVLVAELDAATVLELARNGKIKALSLD